MIHIDEIRLCERRRIQSSFRTSIFSSTIMSSICSICFAIALRLFWCSSYSSSLHHRTKMMFSSSSIKEMTSLSFYSAMFTSSEIISYRHVSWSTIMLRVHRESESCSYCWWSARYWILNECCRSRILYSRKFFRTRSTTDDITLSSNYTWRWQRSIKRRNVELYLRSLASLFQSNYTCISLRRCMNDHQTKTMHCSN